jgi:hypothetical protein
MTDNGTVTDCGRRTSRSMASMSSVREKTGKASKNMLVFKIKTPDGLIKVQDLQDTLDNAISVEVIDFKSGARLGKYKLNEVKLKFF